jgi:hypothetical protein
MPRRGIPSRLSVQTVPAPVGGLNTVSPGLQVPLTECVSAYNLIGAENGLRVRLGYREQSTGMTGQNNAWVRTVLPFTGNSSGQSRIFATTDNGIWDCTLPTPSLVVSFPSKTGLAGYGASVNFVTPAGRFLVYCDEVNGTYVYQDGGAGWTKVTQGAGAKQIDVGDPTRFAFVAVFKSRLWFVERDTSDAWYLPISQVYGTATRFPLGQVFREGGNLVGMWNWTYDGGAGLDDSLVLVSGGGDVAVYQGSDPSSASTFGQRGQWQMARPPAGRRIASTYGGDLLLLSKLGVIPMSQLVVGSVSSLEYATAKVSNLVNRLLNERSADPYWGIHLQPEDNALMVVVPLAGNSEYNQLVQSNASRGWFLYKDLPVVSGAAWQGQFFFGTPDGRLCIHTGYSDNVSIAIPQTFESVDWSFVGAFSNYGSAAMKRVSFMRPLILSEGSLPSYSVEARYNYDTNLPDPVELVLSATGAAWDSAKWDVDTWNGASPPSADLRGTLGIGSSVAVAMRGQSLARTIVVSVDVGFMAGGYL